MTRALITGGAGFIGSHVADALVAAGVETHVLDDLSGGFRDNVADSIRFHEGSVTDGYRVEELFAAHRFDAVYHLAAYAAEGLSHFIRRFNYENNLIGSVNLVNAAVRHETRCFVFTSSIAVYGAHQLPMTEALDPRPEDPYGVAKYAVELDLAAAHRLFGLNYVVFRPHNVYGERQNIGDRYRNVVGIFMNEIMNGEPMTIFGDGNQSRAFTYVGDVAPLLASAASRPETWNRVYNIGSDHVLTVRELADRVAAAMGVEPRVRFLPAREEVVHAFCDHARLREAWSGAPETPLEEGLRRMAAWARANGPRSTPPFAAIELRRNLPEAWRCLEDPTAP